MTVARVGLFFHNHRYQGDIARRAEEHLPNRHDVVENTIGQVDVFLEQRQRLERVRPYGAPQPCLSTGAPVLEIRGVTGSVQLFQMTPVFRGNNHVEVSEGPDVSSARARDAHLPSTSSEGAQSEDSEFTGAALDEDWLGGAAQDHGQDFCNSSKHCVAHGPSSKEGTAQ